MHDPDDAPELSEEVSIDQLDAILEGESSPLNIAPDGGFTPQLAMMPDPIPAALPQNFICLRGCRYYMETRMPAQLGNARGTFDKPPMQVNRFCHRMPGVYITLTDEIVSDCSAWDPQTSEEREDLYERRNMYRSTYPAEFAPTTKEKA